VRLNQDGDFYEPLECLIGFCRDATIGKPERDQRPSVHVRDVKTWSGELALIVNSTLDTANFVTHGVLFPLNSEGGKWGFDSDLSIRQVNSKFQ
jgi:hypothetical protein